MIIHVRRHKPRVYKLTFPNKQLVESTSWSLHTHRVWHWADSPLPVLCPPTSPPWNLTIGTIIIPQRLAPNLWPGPWMWGDVVLSGGAMVGWREGGSGFSSDEHRKGSVTPVNDPQRPLVSCPGTTQWPPLRLTEEPKWPLLWISPLGSLSG